MKNVILITACLLFGYNSQAQSNTSDIRAKVISEAKAHANYFLNLIPQGQESEYGFDSRADFAKVTFGEPYQVYFVVRKAGAVSFQSTNNWRVPILVDGQSVALLTVIADENESKVIDFGAKGLAEKLQAFETEYNAENERVLLRNTYLAVDYIVPQFSDLAASTDPDGLIAINAASSAKLYPVAKQKKTALQPAAFVAATLNAVVK